MDSHSASPGATREAAAAESGPTDGGPRAPVCVEIPGPAGVIRIGAGAPLSWIAGPCVIESQSIMAATAERLKKLSEKLGIGIVFKSSYEKDNRSSEKHYSGPGLEEGLELLAWIKKEFELPVLSDVHRVH